MTLDNMTGITEGSYTGFCKSQLITCNRVKECNGVCPFEDALKHADKTQAMNEQHTVDHDRDWIIGCIEHDGFIHTHRFDKANQIILDALSAEKSNAKTQNSNQETQKSNGDLIYRADAIEAVAKLQKYDLDERNRLRIYTPWHRPMRIFVETEAIYKTIYALPSAKTVQGDGRNNIKRYPNCQMRTSLGNCDVIGGFCTSINAPICDAFHKLDEAVQGWIPCSEKLPKVGEEVLATMEWGDVLIAWYTKFGKWETDDCCDIDDVLAWMPLPTPYKGGDSE